MKPKTEKEEILEQASYMDDDHMQTASATDFTGLIPAGLTYDEEADLYDELCPYLPPRAYIHDFGDLEK